MKSLDMKQLFSQIHLPKREEFRTIGEKARHDWKFILISFFLLGGAFVTTHSLLFIRVDRGEFLNSAPEETSSEEMVKREDLERVIIFFEEKESQFETLRSGMPVVVDPSW